MKRIHLVICGGLALGLGSLLYAASGADSTASPNDSTEAITKECNQWGGSPARNNTPIGFGIPTEWEVGDIDPETGEWDPAGSRNIKWVVPLGSQSYGNPVVADSRLYVGTNNMHGYLERYPADVDLGCLIAFDVKDGKFLWQHSSEKLPTGRVHDWPHQGICSAPLVEGERLWFVTSRGEVRCLDTEGFYDGENDGPITFEEFTEKEEADVIWVLDMMAPPLSVSQHNMASCSVTAVGDTLFVNTSNGVDVEHKFLPAPNAPSFIAVDKNTGKLLWTDASPGENVLHGQWSSPSYGVFDGVPQVIFAGGDGWVYSFDPAGDGNGNSKLLWKFDCNPKRSFYTVSEKATRNHIIATPVIYEGRIYVAVGEDPEHYQGNGHLWCIDPTKRGDVSPELVFNSRDPNTPIPHKRLLACDEAAGDFTRPNPNSAAVWHYEKHDWNGNGEIDDFVEEMHRAIGSCAIKDDILYVLDFSGLFHCVNAKTGKSNWTYDMLSESWGSPLIVDGKVFIGDMDGDLAIFRHSADPKVAMKDEGGNLTPYYGEINMGAAVPASPIVVDNVLYICAMRSLFAIADGAEPVAPADRESVGQ
jgi:outer membrane protein assembly factor BamB